jgi:ABC-2 type transport system ATP-binding protein
VTGPTLEVQGVEKSYGDTVALAGVDLVVEPGTIVGLLGPNGAGKTSLVSIVAGLRRPDAGEVRVGGIDVVGDTDAAQALIGLAPQDTGVYLMSSVRENLGYFAGLAGLRTRDLHAAIERVAVALGLEDLLDRRAMNLSGGERRRLHTAMALVHEPKLVLLDEPTTGADVRTRRQILDLVRELASQGSAVVYSTHYLHEIEELDAAVELIDHGRIVARGGVQGLIRDHGASALVLTFDGDVPETMRVADAVMEGSSVRIAAADPARTAADLLPRLGGDSDRLRAIEVVQPSLEAVFLSLTGRRYESDDDGEEVSAA